MNPSQTIFGHALEDISYDPARDMVRFKFIGTQVEIPSWDSRDQYKLMQILQPIYMQFLQNGGTKGNSNGVSGQATQAVSSHPYGSLAGMQQYQNLLQQQLGNASRYQMQLNQAQQQHAAFINNNHFLQSPAQTSQPVEPLKTEGFKLGEIIAWRGWKITSSGFLRSMSADVIWAPGEPMEGKTKSKEEHNGCYAYKTAREFLKNHEDSGLDVYGKVALWGDVIEHELGYRAEFAKIIAITDFCKSGGSKSTLTDLRERYLLAA